ALALGENILTLNGPISTASGTLTGGTTSSIVLGGTGSGTLPTVTSGLQDLTVNRTGGGDTITLGGALSVSGTLTLTAGTLSNGANLTLGNGATISRATGILGAAP